MLDNAVDIREDGFDIKSGFGYVVLPNPEDVDIEKYQEVEHMPITEFADYGKIAPWAQEAVQFCVDKKIMEGDGTNFRPKDAITREEIACVIQRMMNA